MRNFFYALVLVSLLGFGFFISSKSLASGDAMKVVDPNLPYRIIEIKPSGQQNTFDGASSSFDPTVIIPDLDVVYYPEDKVSAFPDPKLGIGSTIRLQRAPVIKIKDGKKTKDYRSWKTSVEELLSEKNIELGVDDKISSPLVAQIFDGSQIVIIRVAVTNIIEKKSIDFKVVKKEDPNLDKGKTRIATAGIKGEKQLTYQVTREDGVEVNRVLIETKIVAKPTDQIEYIGARPVITVRCRFNDIVIAASIKYKQDPNVLCNLMMKESNGNPNSDGGQWKGLFQYDINFWPDASRKAGFASAAWNDVTAQIYTTAYYFSIDQSWRW